jgi:hypothetical protein
LIPDVSALEPCFLLDDFDNTVGTVGTTSSSSTPGSMGGNGVPTPPTATTSPSTQSLNPAPTSSTTASSTSRSGLSLLTGARRFSMAPNELPLTAANVHANNVNNMNSGNNNNANAGNNNGPSTYTQQELVYIKWQTEMERGFETLVQSIYPYIAELRESSVFSPNRYASIKI